MRPDPRARAAERQRRRRERLHENIQVVPVEVGPELIDRLIAAGRLADDLVIDRDKLARAVKTVAMTAMNDGNA